MPTPKIAALVSAIQAGEATELELKEVVFWGAQAGRLSTLIGTCANLNPCRGIGLSGPWIGSDVKKSNACGACGRRLRRPNPHERARLLAPTS